MPNPLLVGADVHRKTNRLSLLDSQGAEVAPRFTVANNRPGTHACAERLAAVLQQGAFDSLRLADEATGWYGWYFLQALSQEPLLAAWPQCLYAFNPRLPAKFKETYSDLDKTDDVDCFVIADRLRLGRDLPSPFTLDATYLPLRFLTRYRYHLVRGLVREKAYCTALLYLKISEYRPLHPFSDVYGAASRAVLTEFASCEEIAALPLEQLVTLLDTKGRGRFADAMETARQLQRVAQDSYHLPEALQLPVNQVVDSCLQHIVFVEGQVHKADLAIAERLATIPHTLETIPGFGPVYSGGIIAEIGDLARFAYDESKVAKFAGLKWRQTQSADFRADETRLTKTGNRYLRYDLCEAANAVRVHDAEYQAYYQRKYDEVRQHQHQRAIVLTARKLVRLVVRLLTTNQPYRPRRRPAD
jgi:hypothetical protein